MNKAIDQFLQCKKIAVVGMSRSKGKFGNLAVRELTKRGCQVFPVHHAAAQLEGFTCYPDLQSVAPQAQALFISIPSAKVSPILEEAARLNIRHIWLQQGSWSAEVKQAVTRLGLTVVADKCLLMYLQPVGGIHRFHRAINSLFGKL